MRKEGKRRAAAALVCGSMLAVALVGGTMAYLTDTDSDVNVMTLGNVKIEQIELQRADGVSYNNGGQVADADDLVGYEQYQLLFPSAYANMSDYSAKQDSDELFKWGEFVTADNEGSVASNGLWGDSLTGAMDKFVFVKNTGKSDAYYRTVFAFECPEGMEYSEGADKEFMMNVNGNERFAWTGVDGEYVTIDGTRYLVAIATYQKVLEPDTISRPSLLQVVMTHNATNEDMELLGDTYDILALSQAVQTNGFAAPEAALDAAFGAATPEKVVEWFTGMDMSVEITSQDALVRAIEVGDDLRVVGEGKDALEIHGDVVFSGFEMKPSDKENYGSPADYGNIVREGASAIYNNVDLDSKGGGIGIVEGSKVTFNGGSVAVNTTSTSGRYNFYLEGAGSELTINDGDFSFSKTLNQKRAYIYAGAGTTVTVNGGTFGPASTRSGYTAGILGGGTVVIKGGTFGFDPTKWVAEGYQAVKNGSAWTVSTV